MPKKAGESTREMEWQRYTLRLLLVLVSMLLLWGCLSLLKGTKSVAAIVAVVVVMKVIDGVGNALIDRVHKREKDAARGAEAEEKVGALLDALDKERFQVFHDVVLGYGNIDHLVLRRDGAVFAIETKSHAGTITSNQSQLLRQGKPLERDFIKQTLGNALTLGKHLGGYAERQVWVNGLLCFTKGFVKVRGPIKGVQVINIKWLASSLEKGKPNTEIADWLWEHFPTLLTLPPKNSEC